MEYAIREAYGDALVELGAVRKEVVVLDADLAKATFTIKFAKAYPERFFETGIAEQDMLGTAAGLALMGFLPFVSTFAVFAPGRCFDQLRNAVSYMNLNVKLGATHAGISVGEDGGSHQAIEDSSLVRSLPNMTVIVPADATEARAATFAAADLLGPVYLRLSRHKAPVLFDGSAGFTVGKARILREGRQVALFANGLMVAAALEAAEELARRGIGATVVDLHTLKPFDRKTSVEVLKSVDAAVTAEEHTIYGGLGSAVAEVMAEEGLGIPLVRVGINDRFGQSGPPLDLMQMYGLTASDLALAAEKALERSVEACRSTSKSPR